MSLKGLMLKRKMAPPLKPSRAGSMMVERLRGRPGQRANARVMRRDGYICQVCGEQAAEEVDEIMMGTSRLFVSIAMLRRRRERPGQGACQANGGNIQCL
jgi:hypothetical protein